MHSLDSIEQTLDYPQCPLRPYGRTIGSIGAPRHPSSSQMRSLELSTEVEQEELVSTVPEEVLHSFL